MSHLPYHQEQIEFMISLARNRIEWLDPLFRFLNYFDSPYFFFALLPIVWMTVSYRYGLRLFYWMCFSNVINTVAKQIFGWPRPSVDIPDLSFFHFSSFGFPSYAAQTTVFLGGLLIYFWRTKTAWIVAISYILLISFSRLYIGVHYPLDLLGGWILGAALLFLYIKKETSLELWLAKKGLLFSLFLSLILPLIILFFLPGKTIYYSMAGAMGVGIGTYFSLKYHLFLPDPKNLKQGISRAVIALATQVLLLLLWPWAESFSQSFILALFMSLAASPICKWVTD